MPSYPVPFHPIPSHPIPSHPIPSHPIPSHPIPSHHIPCLPITSHPIPSHPIPSHPIPSHPIPSHPIPCHATPCDPMPCHAMPCHAMPCHAMPPHAMPHCTVQEIMLLSRINHPNIVQYLGCEIDDKYLYIFLEYVEMGSILNVLKKLPVRPHALLSKYVRQVLQGLAFLHSMEFVHRDIKCSNILVDKSGTIKLADFGLAKHVRGGWVVEFSKSISPPFLPSIPLHLLLSSPPLLLLPLSSSPLSPPLHLLPSTPPLRLTVLSIVGHDRLPGHCLVDGTRGTHHLGIHRMDLRALSPSPFPKVINASVGYNWAVDIWQSIALPGCKLVPTPLFLSPHSPSHAIFPR
ncbi:unnamed protein product [Closterium sp. NIES-54]